MSISEFSEVLKQQGSVMEVMLPVMMVLGVAYIAIAGGYLAIQKIRKQAADEVGQKRTVIIISAMSALLLAVAAAFVLNVVRIANRLLHVFRESVPNWEASAQTESFRLHLLTMDSRYNILFWGGVVLATVLLAACFFLTRRTKHTYRELEEAKLKVHPVKGLIAVTSSIVPEYDECDNSVGTEDE